MLNPSKLNSKLFSYQRVNRLLLLPSFFWSCASNVWFYFCFCFIFIFSAMVFVVLALLYFVCNFWWVKWTNHVKSLAPCTVAFRYIVAIHLDRVTYLFNNNKTQTRLLLFDTSPHENIVVGFFFSSSKWENVTHLFR